MTCSHACMISGFAALLISACGGPNSGRGLSLPPGDIERGATTFTELGCHSCHTISGRADIQDQTDSIHASIPLGGKVSRISSHGELVTSIINPSHRVPNRHPWLILPTDGGTGMVAINDVMTVTQLVDLVEYLQDQYELPPTPKTYYRPYGY